MIVAGIDIGTNTVRLLVADLKKHPSPSQGPACRTGGPVLTRLHDDRRITRLGEGTLTTGRLQPRAMARTLSALTDFKSAMDHYPIEAVVCAGTSAVREAANGLAFTRQIRQEVGLDVEVISGAEEARRTLLGVEQAVGEAPGTLLVIDIGGGSTELILKSEGHRTQPMTMTTPLGVVKLTEQYLRSDPPSDEDQRRLFSIIETTLRPVWMTFGEVKNPVIVGCAGTVTTLAAMELGMAVYDPGRVQNLRMTLGQVEKWFARLASLRLAERRGIAGLEPGREDLIVAGTAILMTVLRLAGAKEWIVSDAGLREGLLVDWWEHH